MNEGGYMTECDCICECITPSYSRWCFECQLFHYRKIVKQITNEHKAELDKLRERDNEE